MTPSSPRRARRAGSCMSLMRDDVLLREIRRLVDAILRLRRAKPEEKSFALGMLDGDLFAIVGLPASLVDAMSDATLISTISPAGSLDVRKALAIALFLEERARARDTDDDRDVTRAQLLREAALATTDRAVLDEILRELTRIETD
jgi:hypothetical protein